MRIVLDFAERVQRLADGMQVTIPISSRDDVALAGRWCDLLGHTLVTADSVSVTVRRGRSVADTDSLREDRRPGARLWMYTNFDCNLACSYCCVRSSPLAPQRALGADRVARLAREGADAGVLEFFLTGGEPFLMRDIGDSIRACADLRPTTVLTNAMLFKGRRLEVLRSLPRAGVALQISLDSPDAGRHDSNRGSGAWARSVAGIRTALDLGFRVRIAATIDPADREAIADEPRFHELLDEWGIAQDDRLIRPMARRGNAGDGVAVIQEAVIPEVTVTADGVYWHPVGADDRDMLVTSEMFPLGPAIARVVELFAAHRERAAVAAQLFHCA